VLAARRQLPVDEFLRRDGAFFANLHA